MCEFKVLSINEFIEKIEYLEYKCISITIPNLEEFFVLKESVFNFQHRLFQELENLFWDPLTYKYPYIRIERNSSYYIYTIRITNIYNYNNIYKIESIVNYIFSDFPFKYSSRKRRSLENLELITNLKKMKV